MRQYLIRTDGFARDNHKLLELSGQTKDCQKPNIRDIIAMQRMSEIKYQKPKILKAIGG